MDAKKTLLLALSLGAVASLTAVFVVYGPGRVSEKKRGMSGAYQALNSWAAQRAYPHRVVPDVGYALAYEELRNMRGRDGGVDDLIGPWETLGPANIGGRTLALALHPHDSDIIFAGSASGGLWKSTSGGIGADAWDYVETGFPVLGVSAIAIDPSDPDVMYIGTGEVYRYQDSIGGEVIRTTRGSYGIGILKSIDGGLTWTKSLDWTYAQTRGVWAVRIHPTNSDILYAGTTEGVYKSVNAGGTWNLVLDVVMATDVRIHPTFTHVVLAACGNFSSEDHGIYRSNDGGSAWNRITTGLPTSWTGKALLDISLSSPNIIFASIADSLSGRGLYRSTDTGASWQLVNSLDYPSYQGWYSHWVLVSPTDPNRVFVGGIEIWRSLDGGASFTRVSDWTQIYYGAPQPGEPGGGPQYAHADQHQALFHPTHDDTMFIASDGGVFRTINGGDTFEGLNGSYITTQFYNGFSNSASDVNLALGGMQDNMTAIYQGTNAWYRVIGGDGSWTAINPLNDNTMYGSYQYLGMLRSRDGGYDWRGISPPQSPGDQTAFVAPYVLSLSEPTVLYAGRSRVYKSMNEGTNWAATHGSQPLDGYNPVLSMAVSAAGSDTVYAATAPIYSRARVFRTTNGDDWEDVTGALPDRYPADLAVDPGRSEVVYVALMGFGSSHVFKSVDGGDSWMDIGAGLPDVPTSAVEVDPDYPDILYAGTDLGVFISLDAGGSWEPFMNGMPTAQVNDLKVFGPGRILRAATHGNGVFERDLYDPILAGVHGADTSGGGPSAVSLTVHPNPLVSDSRIAFRLPQPGHVRLSLFDVRGRRLAVLVDEAREAGEHSIPLDQARLSIGVFFAKLETEDGVFTTRVIYLR